MLVTGTILQNRYRVVGKLGQGGMGTVYEAFDQRLHAAVALKEAVIINEHLQKQFEREALLLAQLNHPALTKVYDYFSENEKQYLVMEFVPGEDLWTTILKQRTPFPVDEVLRWTDQLLDALDYLHSQNPPIIHRDIKPHNLKLTNRGQIKLLDFGLAKGATGSLSQASAAQSVFGYTLSYAALEQIQGTGTDPRSDLYSLAATLYHFVTASVPPDALTRITEIANERPDPLRTANAYNPQISPALATLLTQAMSHNRDKRPASAALMRQSLRAMTTPMTTPRNTGPQETLKFNQNDLPFVPPSSPSFAPTERMTAPQESQAVQTNPSFAPFSPTQSQTTPPVQQTVQARATQQMFVNAGGSKKNWSYTWLAAPLLGLLFFFGVGAVGISVFLGYKTQSPTSGGRPDTDLPDDTSSSNTNANTSATPNAHSTPTPTNSPTTSPTKGKPTPTPEKSPTPENKPSPEPTPQSKPTPTPKPPPKIIQGGVVNGKAVSLPAPAYPAVAKAAKASGTVVVQVTIDETGKVISASAISGHPLLKASAVQAAYNARFSPTMLSGQPVKVTGQIIYNFVLN